MTATHQPSTCSSIGGGPAGATAAALLASWGRSVVMVHREDSPSLAESLPASTRKLLRFSGLLEVVDAARFHPNQRQHVAMGGKSSGRRAGGRPAITCRARIRSAAAGACPGPRGALVDGQVQRVEVWPVRRPSKASDRSGAASTACRLRSRLLRPRGRRSPQGTATSATGYRTLAVAAEWDCDGWPDA